MNPVQNEHGLNHIAGVVRHTRAQGQEFQAQVILRFDKLDQSFATLSDRLNNLSQQLNTNHTRLQDNHNHVEEQCKQIRTGLGNLKTTLIDQVGNAIIQSVQVVRDTIGQVRNRVDNFDLHIVQPIQAAVSHTETVVLGRIGELGATVAHHVNNHLPEVISSSEERIRNAIETEIQAARTSHTDALGQASTAIVAAVQAPRNDVAQLQNVCNEIRGQTQGIAAIGTTCNAIRDDKCREIKDDIDEVRNEMRAGHANNAARLYNKFASCCNNSIAPFRGIDNGNIDEIPATYSDFNQLGGDIDTILTKLGLSRKGRYRVKKQRLKVYLGLRK